MAGKKNDGYWIPLADLMTVLMIIFLFMAISYMALVQKKQKNIDVILTGWEDSKNSMISELNSIFKNDFKKWNMVLDDDMSIKFVNPQALFEVGSEEITPYYEDILREFFPKYLGVITQKKYLDKIAEIRIEGHTDVFPITANGDPYIENMELSQGRARNVLGFLRKQPCFTNLPPQQKESVQFWFTANGLSFSRTIDMDGNLTRKSGKPVVNGRSRRVEFRIITTSDIAIQQAINKISNK